MTYREIAIIATLLIPFWLTSFLGLPEVLGAHPWWAAKSSVIGSLIGAVGVAGWWILLKETKVLFRVALLGLLMSAYAAILGKQVFVASYAENGLAGRFWFLGWFGLFACLFALVSSLMLRRVSR